MSGQSGASQRLMGLLPQGYGASVCEAIDPVRDALATVDCEKNTPGADSQSPITWHYTATPDKVEGQVACGTYKDGPDVIWTRNADLMLADGQGPDMAALHQWWLKYG